MTDRNKPIGSYTPHEICQHCSCNKEFRRDGSGWHPARPIPYKSLKERIKMSIDVLMYKADVIYW